MPTQLIIAAYVSLAVTPAITTDKIGVHFRTKSLSLSTRFNYIWPCIHIESGNLMTAFKQREMQLLP